MKKTMFVTMMTLMLVGMIASVSAYELKDYSAEYNKRTNEITFRYTEVLDNECTRTNLRNYLLDKDGEIISEVGGRSAVRICYMEYNGRVYFDNRQTGEIQTIYTIQLDEKLKNKNLTAAELRTLPLGRLTTGGELISSVDVKVVK